MFDVIVAMIALPREPFRHGTEGHEDMLVLAVAHGHGDGGVVEKETVSLPGWRCVCDPVVPGVDETFMQDLEVYYS